MGHLRWRVLRRPLTFAEGCCLRRHTNVWVWCLLSHISAILLQSLCGVGEDSFAEAVVPRLVPGRQGAGPQFWPTPPRHHIVFHTSFGLANHRLQSWSEAVGVIKVCTGKVALQHPDSSSEFSLECNWETLDCSGLWTRGMLHNYGGAGGASATSATNPNRTCCQHRVYIEKEPRAAHLSMIRRIRSHPQHRDKASFVTECLLFAALTL